MTTIGPKLEQLVNAAVTDKVITKKEAEDIQKEVKSEVEKGETTPEKALEFINSRLKDTNAVMAFKSETKGEANVVNFKMTGSSKTSPDLKVTDFQKIAESDAKQNKDIQYKALSRYPQNYISYDQKTGDITGSQLVKNGETRKGPDGKLVTSQAPNPTVKKKMSDLILSDFNKYADPPLAKTFPNPSGADDLTKALKEIKDNNDNPNITKENVSQLLSYINTGKNTSGISSVKELQSLLSNMTGKTGTSINNKNNPDSGDDKYGYATTLQVRSLASKIRTENFETNIELEKKIPPAPEKYSNALVFIDNSSSTNRMRAEQTKNIEDNIKNDPAWKDVKVEKISFGNEKGSMNESIIQASSSKLDAVIPKMKPGEKVLLSAFVDTNDSTSLKEFKDLKAKIADAKSEGKYIDFKITFGNIQFDINDIKEDFFKNKTDNKPLENLEWIKVVKDKLNNLEPKDFLKSVSLMESSSSVPKEIRDEIYPKFFQLKSSDFESLKNDNGFAASYSSHISYVQAHQDSWKNIKPNDTEYAIKDALINSSKIGDKVPDILRESLEKKLPKNSKSELETLKNIINSNKKAGDDLKQQLLALIDKALSEK